jgi:hypothetical protein
VANLLLRRLLEGRSITAPQLELFQHCVSDVHLSGPTIKGSWLAHLSGFAAVTSLRLTRCTKLRDAHLQHLVHLAPTLETLGLAGCSGLTDGALQHIQHLTALRSLDLTDTALGDGLAAILPCLARITSLDVTGVRAFTDVACAAAGQLPLLQRLCLHGTAVTGAGMAALCGLQGLQYLDVSWTAVSPQIHVLLPTVFEFARSCTL